MKHNFLRRTGCALLLLCSLPGYALAAGALSGRTEISGSVAVSEFAQAFASAPVIQVTVPVSEQIVINPYRMRVNTADTVSTEQVICPDMTITSTSGVPLIVTARATGAFPSDSRARLISTLPDDESTEKELFLYLEFSDSGDQNWSGAYNGAENQLLINDGEADVMRLEAAENDAPVYGTFRMFGEASDTPKEPWNVEDSIHVTVYFTFTADEVDAMETTDEIFYSDLYSGGVSTLTSEPDVSEPWDEYTDSDRNNIIWSDDDTVPDNGYTEPDDSYTEPDDSYTEPDDSYAEPDDSYTEPDDSYAEPDDSYTEPDEAA